MKRVLVTGASGLLGGRLAELLARRFDVVATRHRAPVTGSASVALDLGDAASIEAAVAAARPDAIVHAAAMAEADACERDPDAARRLNTEGSAVLARAAHRAGAHLIAISTDLVLAGDRAMTPEDVAAQPILVYGRTKLAAEEAVLAEAPSSAVLRTALVLGRGYGPRHTASEAIGDALREGRSLRLFRDQYRTPIDAESVADAVRRVVERRAAGRFHVGGALRLSRYELGIRVAAVLGLPSTGVESVRQADLPLGAPRPADTSLDTTRARTELGWTPRPLDEAIREGRARERSGDRSHGG